MSKELVIISDLWGKKSADWTAHFKALLPDDTILKFYDATLLGNVDLEDKTQEEIHSQFMDFGIEAAVKELIKSETDTKTYIGCSIGGVIAWKTALQGLKLDRLITISSTRLRYETQSPNCEVRNYFGTTDEYKPKWDWMEGKESVFTKLISGGHDIYKDESTLLDIFRDAGLLGG